MVISITSYAATAGSTCDECTASQQVSIKIDPSVPKLAKALDQQVRIKVKKNVSFNDSQIAYISTDSKAYIYLFKYLPCQKGQPKCDEKIDYLKSIESFLSSTPKNQDIVIVLNMDGGELHTTYQLIELLQNQIKDGRRIQAYVPPEAVCTSACIPLFTSLQERLAGTSARFGFHQCTGDDDKISESATKKYLETMISHGVEKDWIQNKFPKGSASWVAKPNQLSDSNISPNLDNHLLPPTIAQQLTKMQNVIPVWGNPFKSNNN